MRTLVEEIAIEAERQADRHRALTRACTLAGLLIIAGLFCLGVR